LELQKKSLLKKYFFTRTKVEPNEKESIEDAELTAEDV
jgi:hypothetical protein